MKLKPIPLTTVVHTPTEAEAKELLAILHENGYEWHNGSNLTYTHWEVCKDETCYQMGLNMVAYADVEEFDGIAAILTLAEFKEKYVEEEKPQPKFKVGDKVRIIQDGTVNPNYVGIVDEIAEVGFVIKLKNTDSNWGSEALEPYPKPETTKETKESEETFASDLKPTEDMGIKENRNLSQDVANCDKPEDKELNLCELLKGHVGEEFFSLAYGVVMLEGIRRGTQRGDSPDFLCVRATSFDSGTIIVNPNGKLRNAGVVDLFPSRALYEQYPLDPYTAWMKWQEEQKSDLHISWYSQTSPSVYNYNQRIDFRTPANRDKCLSEIEAIIEKYSKK